MSNTAGSGKRPGPELQHVPCVAAGPPAGSAAADVRRVLPPAPAGQPGGVLPGAAVAAAGQPAVLQPPAQPPSQQQHPKQPGPAAAPAPAAGAPQAPSSDDKLLRPSIHSSNTAPAATTATTEAPAAADSSPVVAAASPAPAAASHWQQIQSRLAQMRRTPGASAAVAAGACEASTHAAAQQQPAAAAAAVGVSSDTLPVGLKLRLDLQEVRLKGAGKYQCVQEVKAIGVAHAEVLQLLGVGGNAQAYLCSLSEYQLSDALPAGSFRPPWRAGRPPAKVVLKVPHKLAGLTAEQHSRYQEVSQIIAWSEHDLLSKPKLRECQFIINSYGFCAARAVGGELLRGLDCQPCLMLEWAELGSLWEKVAPAKGPPAPLDAVACRQVVSQLCRAVRAVHEAGYLHRDIKPDNLLMSRMPGNGGCVIYKLCDFGSAVPADRLHPLRNERDEGTPAYLPPELFWQTTSDTWQVGKCMLALRSGAVPHSGAFEEVRASGLCGSLADPLRESEWVFLEMCLNVNSGSRTDPLALWERGVYPDCL